MNVSYVTRYACRPIQCYFSCAKTDVTGVQKSNALPFVAGTKRDPAVVSGVTIVYVLNIKAYQQRR